MNHFNFPERNKLVDDIVVATNNWCESAMDFPWSLRRYIKTRRQMFNAMENLKIFDTFYFGRML